jgi:DNA polymerase I
VCALAVQYGMGAETLAAQLGLQPIFGRKLLAQHKRTFPKFWQWIEQVQVTAKVKGKLQSALGWELQVTGATKPNTLSNWPCQANGSEMLRLALIAASRRK